MKNTSTPYITTAPMSDTVLSENKILPDTDLSGKNSSEEKNYSEENFSPDELVDLEKFCPGILLDIRYASENNFTGKILYEAPKAYLRRAVAEKICSVQDELKKKNFSLKIYDAYRPLAVQWVLWNVTPDKKYIANPVHGSKHNRGAAVDLTIVDSAGRELDMGTDFDNFTEKAHHSYANFPKKILENRALLRYVMLRHGFHPIPHEWWHYDADDWKNYPVMDISFSELEKNFL